MANIKKFPLLDSQRSIEFYHKDNLIRAGSQEYSIRQKTRVDP